jgi:hypothetical protein
VVMSEAAMMRSPSFSLERSSRTTMNSPFSRADVSQAVLGGVVGVLRRGDFGGCG